MSKISRREYLKQMGASGLIIGAAELDCFALESTNAKEQSAKQQQPTQMFTLSRKLQTRQKRGRQLPQDFPAGRELILVRQGA